MAATVENLAQVLEAIETDLPNSVLSRFLDTAEEDVRAILTTGQRALLPVVLWEGDLSPVFGSLLETETLATPTVYPILQFDGIVNDGTSAVPYHTQSKLFIEGAVGTDSIIPLTEAGVSVTVEAFTATYNASETAIEFTSTQLAVGVSVTRISWACRRHFWHQARYGAR